MVFAMLIFANIFLSLANRSFVYSVFASVKNKNRLFPIVIGATLILLFVILYVRPVGGFFQVEGLTFSELAMTCLIAAVSVMWVELFKWFKRTRIREKSGR